MDEWKGAFTTHNHSILSFDNQQMTHRKHLLLFLCSFTLLFLLTSCGKKENEVIVTENPTLAEIHANGAKTLNELLLDYESHFSQGTSQRNARSEQWKLRGYGPRQHATYHGFTDDVRLSVKPHRCYLHEAPYQGYTISWKSILFHWSLRLAPLRNTNKSTLPSVVTSQRLIQMLLSPCRMASTNHVGDVSMMAITLVDDNSFEPIISRSLVASRVKP